ncbi:hypothetical protein TEA_002343 [Camellia sinensis var. sinensis]|uniref:RRM domain-containing protein n=1 Tax=Camellia sinensis var. sinensis TaxID=542762 RepID=A0A4S4DDR2_CAMSN|nr:hypothetical protein TEA_002343 [Camellia sinensis var. sinensis]
MRRRKEGGGGGGRRGHNIQGRRRRRRDDGSGENLEFKCPTSEIVLRACWYYRSPSPYGRYSRSVSRSVSRSRSISRSRSRSRESSVENPGNNLYVTGLSARVTKRDLEKHFLAEGKVEDVHLVVDPWTRESRGFGFVTMSTVEEANRCVKYLSRSVLEGRVIMVEKARRRRGRTPTPGRYLGLRTIHVRRGSPSYSPYHRSRSPRYSSERDRSRSYSPYYYRRRSYSPHYDRYSRRSYSRSCSPFSRSPVRRHDRSYSRYDSRYYSPEDCYYRRRRHQSVSRSISPRVRRSYSNSVSPGPRRRSSRKSYSRSVSPRRRRRSYSRSISPVPRRNSRRSISRDSYWRSRSGGPRSRSVSRSVTPSRLEAVEAEQANTVLPGRSPVRRHDCSYSRYTSSSYLINRRLLYRKTPPSICPLGAFTKGEEELFKQCVTWAKEGEVKEELPRAAVSHQRRRKEKLPRAFPPYQGGTQGGVFPRTAIGGVRSGGHGPDLFQGLLLLLGSASLVAERLKITFLICSSCLNKEQVVVVDD